MTRPKPWRNMPPATIVLAGIPIRRELVEWLAENVDEPAAARLARTLSGHARVVALEVDEREQILRAVDDPPDGLTELRAVLFQDVIAWRREGLS